MKMRKVLLPAVFLSLFFISPGPPSSPTAYGHSVFTGIVYHDYNQNGVRDPNEPGVAGALIELYTDEMVTDASGLYSLRESVSNNWFIIRETDPWGFKSTTLNEVWDDTFWDGPKPPDTANHFGDVAAEPSLLPCKAYVPTIEQP